MIKKAVFLLMVAGSPFCWGAHFLFGSSTVSRLEFHPVSVFAGTAAGSYSVKTGVNNFLGINLTGTQASLKDQKMEGWSAGLVDTYLVTVEKNHPVIRGKLSVGQMLTKKSEQLETRRADYVSALGHIGYSWNWDDGLGVILTGGLGYLNGNYSGNKEDKIRIAATDISVGDNARFAVVFPDAELALAYTF